MLAGGRAPRDKRKARFLVSALQSEIFNAVLDARGDGFDGVLLGDLATEETPELNQLKKEVFQGYFRAVREAVANYCLQDERVRRGRDKCDEPEDVVLCVKL